MAIGTVRTGAPADVKAIAALVAEHGVTRIVVGHPLPLRGGSNEGSDQAERFADALRGFLGLPVDLQDERLSTVEAERALGAAGVRGRDRRAVVDQAAAAVILQAWLDRTRGAGR